MVPLEDVSFICQGPLISIRGFSVPRKRGEWVENKYASALWSIRIAKTVLRTLASHRTALHISHIHHVATFGVELTQTKQRRVLLLYWNTTKGRLGNRTLTVSCDKDNVSPEIVLERFRIYDTARCAWILP